MVLSETPLYKKGMHNNLYTPSFPLKYNVFLRYTLSKKLIQIKGYRKL